MSSKKFDDEGIIKELSEKMTKEQIDAFLVRNKKYDLANPLQIYAHIPGYKQGVHVRTPESVEMEKGRIAIYVPVKKKVFDYSANVKFKVFVVRTAEYIGFVKKLNQMQEGDTLTAATVAQIKKYFKK